MAVIMASVAAGFCIYGGLLFNSLRKAPTKTLHPEGGNCFKTFNQLGELPKRLFIVTAFFSVSFLGEAICWIISAATPDFAGRGSDITTGIYLSFDCICILTLIFLFYKTVNEYGRASKTDKPNAGSVNGSSGSGRGSQAGKTLKPSERRAADAKKSSTKVERTTNDQSHGQTMGTERSDVVAGGSQFTGSNVSRVELEMQSVVGDLKEEDAYPKVPETPTSGDRPLLIKTNMGSSVPEGPATPINTSDVKPEHPSVAPVIVEPVSPVSPSEVGPVFPVIVQPVSPNPSAHVDAPSSPSSNSVDHTGLSSPSGDGSAPLIVDPVSNSSSP